jgi:hypothetical protein
MTEGAPAASRKLGRLDLLIVVRYWPQAGLGLLAWRIAETCLRR